MMWIYSKSNYLTSPEVSNQYLLISDLHDNYVMLLQPKYNVYGHNSKVEFNNQLTFQFDLARVTLKLSKPSAIKNFFQCHPVLVQLECNIYRDNMNVEYSNPHHFTFDLVDWTLKALGHWGYINVSL